MKRIVILGSTGSIGRSALDVASRYPERFRVAGLTANRNVGLLSEQVARFRPEVVAVPDPGTARQVEAETGVAVAAGPEGLASVAAHQGVDFVLSAIVGAAGLLPTLAAVRAGRTIGLANKETLVVAGDLVMEEARRSGATILPVDSEHNAVFQCIEGRDPASVRRIMLTASGGPFSGRDRDGLRAVTRDEALNHPSWDMGPKITVDSATLMNKGLEVIEAHHLFGLPAERIGVVIHPQSIVHSIVEFRDGGSLAQLSVPDMRAAIAYALSYPERLEDVIPPLDFWELGSLDFRRPDLESFRCLGLAYEALKSGGTMPAVLNAANEAAVEAFLEERIGFLDIPALVEETMEAHEPSRARSIEDVLDVHRWAHQRTAELIRAAAAR